MKHIQKICRFDGSIGDNLNLFGSIQCVYCALNPSFRYTTKYEDAFDLYLESVQDCFDGPDVSQVTESIIRNALDISTKAGRRKRAKAEIKEYFHADGKRPRWIQGPEWPMGKYSPMKFEKQIKTAKVHYMCLETLIQMKRR